MNKLLDKKIYIPVWNIGNYVHKQGFVNIFDLHKKLEAIIRIHHLPNRKESSYTKEEKQYMDDFLRCRKMINDRGLFSTY